MMRLQQIFRIAMLALVAWGFCVTSGHAQYGKVYGTVTEDGDALPMTPIMLKQGETIIKYAMTDLEGKYEIALISPGSYQLVVQALDDEYTYEIKLGSGESEIQDLAIASGGTIYTPYREVFSVDPKVQTTILPSDIRETNIRTPADIIAVLSPGVYQPDQGDPLNMRGTRAGATTTFINGVKVIGPSELPAAAIGQIDVVTGGIPASIGDASGAVILIQTQDGLRGSGGKYYSRAERRDIRRRKKGRDKDSFRACDLEVMAFAQ